MMNANILLIIHGVVMDTVPSSHTVEYDELRAGIVARQPDLKDRIDAVIGVEWGHAPLPVRPNLLPDEKLTAAENTLVAATAYGKIKAEPTPDDSFLEITPDFPLRLFLRPVISNLKEQVLTFGIADALYYCTADGEKAVRDHVYSEFMAGMERYKAADKVAIHLIGHSQGATIGFDFLFGLFAPDAEFANGIPGFVEDEQGSPEMQQAYMEWREAAQAGRLVLGSKASFGSQLGLMMLRRQKLVDRLAAGERLDPTVIGVPKTGSPKWKIFYDTDDVLGFAARRLFDAVGSIREYEVYSDWNPLAAHTNYRNNETVQREIAALILENLI